MRSNDSKTPKTGTVTIPALLLAAEVRAADVAGEPALLAVGGLAAVALIAFLAGYVAAPLTRRLSRRLERRRLRGVLRRNSLELLDDFILPGAYDGLTRIHYAALTPAGILCVQTRHCEGRVSGTERTPQWCDVRGQSRQQFLNPVIQNDGHVKALTRITGDVPVVNLVVFTGAARFSDRTNPNVVHLDALEARIRDLVANATELPALREAWQALKRAARTDAATRKDLEAQLTFG